MSGRRRVAAMAPTAAAGRDAAPEASRILVVEDERIVALDLRSTLEMLGYAVVGICSRGPDAVALAGELLPDLVLMDIHLEEHTDGIMAAREIRDRFRLPVVFLTAYAEEQTIARAAASAPYGYLIKPFQMRELDATVRMALARRRIERELEATGERLRLALDAAELGVWEADLATDRLDVAGHFERLIGAPLERFGAADEGFMSRIAPEDRAGVLSRLEAGEELHTTLRVTLADGRAGWAELHAKPHRANGDGASRVIGVIRDVTRRRQYEEHLRRANVVFQNIGEGILILDTERRIIAVNPAMTALTGYEADEVLGRGPDDFLHARRRNDQFYAELMEEGHGYWQGEVAFMRRDGEVFMAWQQICTVREESGEIANYVITFTDLSALRRAEDKLNYLAYHDALTGLGNRFLLEQRLDSALAEAARSGRRLAVIFIDLDGFKHVNDTMGHGMGDLLLKGIAGRIRDCMRRDDLAVRLGGDEFIIVAPDLAEHDDCMALATKLIEVVREPVELGGEPVQVSASIGISLYPDHGATQHELIRACDSAMYEAKARGRNQFAFYSSDLRRRARERVSVEQGLRRALHGDGFELRYRPQAVLDGGGIVAVEALPVWPDPELGEIPPERLAAVAEESGFGEALGEWSLRTACREAARWARRPGPAPRVAVHVSGRQLGAGGFAKQVAAVLEESGLEAGRLEVRLAEAGILQARACTTVLAELKALGLTIAVHRFGSGYSSLGMLHRLPIDLIVVDGAYVAGLPDDGEALAVTGATVAVARHLGLTAAADGIATAAQATLLREMGCVYGQGPCFGELMSAPDLEAMFAASRRLKAG